MTNASGASIQPRAQANSGLADEGRLLASYLLREEPSPRAIELYVAACSALEERLGDKDPHTLRFVVRHPWSLPWVDAASALLSPQGLLRTKLFIALAVLEMQPAHATAFTPRPRSRWRLGLQLGFLGVLAVALLVVGVPLYYVASRSR